MPLRVELEQDAEEDLRAAARYYRKEAGVDIAEQFLTRVQEVLALIAAQPDMGENYGELALRAELEELQWFPLRDFPFNIYWTHDDATVSIWGVVQANHDLPEILRRR